MTAPSTRSSLLGCVVAGGKSSRMGRDKAALVVGGCTLLSRACSVLSAVCTEVVVSGDLRVLPPGVQALADERPGCGPLGGIVTALQFARDHSYARTLFLPVDMPLLPPGLIAALCDEWSSSERVHACVCCVVADGIVQPLISCVHTQMLPALTKLLHAGDFRVWPSLERAAAERDLAGGSPAHKAVHQSVLLDVETSGFGGWRPTSQEKAVRHIWFLNVNTPEDLSVAERALDDTQDPRRPAVGE